MIEWKYNKGYGNAINGEWVFAYDYSRLFQRWECTATKDSWGYYYFMAFNSKKEAKRWCEDIIREKVILEEPTSESEDEA